MSHPLVSIITPTYNHEQFIEDCIQSVLCQDTSSWEMIIVDDESTDRTTEIVEQFDDPRIELIRQSHQGIWNLNRTYNRALSRARGEFIAILEGDDFWPPGKLRHQLAAFDHRDVILTWGCGAEISRGPEVTRQVASVKAKTLYTDFSPEEIAMRLAEGNVIRPAVTVMVRRDTLIRHGGFLQYDYTPYVDFPTWQNLALNTLGRKAIFRFVNLPLGIKARHSGQTTVRLREKMICGRAKLMRRFATGLSTRLEAMDVKQLERVRALSEYLMGKSMLDQAEWRAARLHFRKAIASGDIRVKAYSVFGLMGTFVRQV